MKGVIYLTIAILAEVFATVMLKLSEGFTILLPTFSLIVGYSFSFYCLSLCLKTLPLSLAHAIWAGAGTALTALLGVMIWGEAITAFKIIGLVFIVGGVVALNSSHETETVKQPAS